MADLKMGLPASDIKSSFLLSIASPPNFDLCSEVLLFFRFVVVVNLYVKFARNDVKIVGCFDLKR